MESQCIPVVLEDDEPPREAYTNHHWVIEEAEGRKFIEGVCKKCGIKKSTFRGISSIDSGDTSLWGTMPPPKRKKDYNPFDEIEDKDLLL